ncbi:MAG TPA: PilZ domain-containing protein [Terriglobia bacterium]|nr:PilZ domain-containing protein [Terriglobia bacterium]
MGGQGREFITPEIDKRQHRRAKLVTHVKCESMNRDELLVTRDISIGGLFINTKTPLPLDSQVGLSFSLAAGHPAITCKGKVVFSRQDMGMGIEFSDLNTESRQSLEKFVDEVN